MTSTNSFLYFLILLKLIIILFNYIYNIEYLWI